jgi:exodeoxyribonuclease VII small subunit
MPPSFETSLARLEAIVSEVENADIGLEASMDLYKEGLAISKTCHDLLGRFEQEILVLKTEADGLFNLTPYSLNPTQQASLSEDHPA